VSRHVDANVRAYSTSPETGRVATVGDVMNRAVVSAYRGALFKEIARALARNDIDTVPVVDEDHKVIGVVTASDLLARLVHPRLVPRGHRLSAQLDAYRKRHAACAKDLMTHPAVTTTPDTTVVDAARLAARFRIRSLPVVDDHGALVGMITRSDLVKLFLRGDEDIRRSIEKDLVPRSTVAGCDAVHVDVVEGVVTLSGTVRDQLTVRDLTASTARLPGVVDVRCELKVHSSDVFLPLGH
jgi:CBS domain-containing protein